MQALAWQKVHVVQIEVIQKINELHFQQNVHDIVAKRK
jgi:hypothetical protein